MSEKLRITFREILINLFLLSSNMMYFLFTTNLIISYNNNAYCLYWMIDLKLVGSAYYFS